MMSTSTLFFIIVSGQFLLSVQGLDLRLKGQKNIPINQYGQATETVDITDLPVGGCRRYDTLECLSDVPYRGRIPNAYWNYTDLNTFEVHQVDDIRCKGNDCKSPSIGWQSTLDIYRKGRSYYFVVRLGRSNENAKEGAFTCFVEGDKVTVEIGHPSPPDTPTPSSDATSSSVSETTTLPTPTTIPPTPTPNPSPTPTTSIPPTPTPSPPSDFTCKMDILFLLDTTCVSGKEFKKVKTFLSVFVDNLTAIGPHDNQVGLITLADDAQVAFTLDQYNTSTGLINATEALQFSGGKANFAEGLCSLRKGFEENGARPVSPEVLRVAIIISAGNAGKPSNKQCRDDDTTHIEEAEMLRNEVGVYVIGITDDINYEVLNAIASQPTCGYVRDIDSFHRVPDIKRYIDDICMRGYSQASTNPVASSPVQPVCPLSETTTLPTPTTSIPPTPTPSPPSDCTDDIILREEKHTNVSWSGIFSGRVDFYIFYYETRKGGCHHVQLCPNVTSYTVEDEEVAVVAVEARRECKTCTFQSTKDFYLQSGKRTKILQNHTIQKDRCTPKGHVECTCSPE